MIETSALPATDHGLLSTGKASNVLIRRGRTGMICCQLLIACILLAGCRNAGETAPGIPAPEQSLLFAFYNVENLWDPADDPSTTGDDEFTPQGRMKWTRERYEKKLAALARVIRDMNDGEGPDLLGICEIENRDVLERLVHEFLPAGRYGIVHAESPDLRGIDVAILYRSDVVDLKHLTMHRIDLGDGTRPTRDIMEGTFARDGVEFTVLVNHWPSRSGGAAQTEPLRKRAAAAAASVIDSLHRLDPDADIVLMGDLNDEPYNASVQDVLDAGEYSPGEKFERRMINTAMPVAAEDTIGSYYYDGGWEVIDQIMLSPGALDRRGLTLYEISETIFTPEFLRDSRASPADRPPYRTYIRGTQYIGGTSDHFPVMLRVGWAGKEK